MVALVHELMRSDNLRQRQDSAHGRLEGAVGEQRQGHLAEALHGVGQEALAGRNAHAHERQVPHADVQVEAHLAPPGASVHHDLPVHAHAGDQRFGGLLAYGHEPDVDSAPIGVAFHQCRHVVPLVVVDGVTAPLAGDFQLRVPAGRSGHPAAAPLRDLQGGAADAGRDRLDQDALARPEPGHGIQRMPRGQPAHRDRGPLDERNRVGKRHQVIGVEQDGLGMRTAGPAENAIAGLELADFLTAFGHHAGALHAHDERQFLSRIRAGAHARLGEIHAGCPYLNEHLARTRLKGAQLAPLHDFRAAEPFDQETVHGRSSGSRARVQGSDQDAGLSSHSRISRANCFQARSRMFTCTSGIST